MSVNSTYITEDLLSLGHPAQLRAVAVRIEVGLLFIPVLRVKFLNKVLSHELPNAYKIFKRFFCIKSYIRYVSNVRKKKHFLGHKIQCLNATLCLLCCS